MNTRPVLVDQHGNPLIVDISGIADGDVLTYDAASGLWIPAATGSGGGVGAHTGDTTDAHDASAISFDDTGATNISAANVQDAIDDLDAAIAGVGGSVGGWDAEIDKPGNEDVTSSTTLQDDNDLFFTATTAVMFEFELALIISSASGGGGTTADIKFVLGEDSTTRGMGKAWGMNFTSGVREDIRELNLAGTSIFEYGTQSGKFLVYVRGWHLGNGGTFKLQWAQRTSDAGNTRVCQHSRLRYRAVG